MGVSVSAMLYHIELWWENIPRFMHLNLQHVMFPPEKQKQQQQFLKQWQMKSKENKQISLEIQSIQNQMVLQHSEQLELPIERRPPYSKEIPPFYARCDKCHAKMYFVSQLGQIVQEHVQIQPTIKINAERSMNQRAVILKSQILAQGQPPNKKSKK